jgi:hypothetical protein
VVRGVIDFRARASATVEPRLERAEKLIRCTIVVRDL